MNERSPSAFLAAMAMAAAFLSCASIPSLNEAPVYSSYVDERRTGAGIESVRVFVLHRARGQASEDLHEFLVEARADASGTASFLLVLGYKGYVAENISGMSASVDGRDLELGEVLVERGYSGRYISERLRAALPEGALSALMGGSRLALRYSCDFPAPVVELSGPGFEALKAFIGR